MAVSSVGARVRALPASERRLLVAAWLGLAISPIVMTLVPFRALRKWAEREPRRDGGGHEPGAPRVAELVEAAGRHHVVATSCLSRSLLLCRLLRRHGHPARLVLGAARTDGRLEAHAWVESGGQRLSAGPLDRFVPLLEGPDRA